MKVKEAIEILNRCNPDDDLTIKTLETESLVASIDAPKDGRCPKIVSHDDLLTRTEAEEEYGRY